MFRENIEAFVQAFSVDLRKPRLEVLGGELGHIISRAAPSAVQLDEWAADENVQVSDWKQSWSPTILKRPKGVVLVISCVIFSIVFLFPRSDVLLL
jgi:acyl-CoA reductase-like NAD-dependent aldehyde dehydrogenase